MKDDPPAADEAAAATKPLFQFDIRAIMAVTATVAVVLASVGRERAPELLIAACTIAVVVSFDYWLVRRFRRFVAAWRAPGIGSKFAWMLLGALGGYIVLISTDVYSELRHVAAWTMACGIAGMFGATAGNESALSSVRQRAALGALIGAVSVGPAFLLDFVGRQPSSSLVAGFWETVCAALAGAAIVLAVNTLRRLEAHWQLPRYAIPCIWLIAASAFAELGSHFVTGW